MNETLHQLACRIGLEQPEQAALRCRFGLACAKRVSHLLEEPRAIEGLAALEDYVAGKLDAAGLARAAEELALVSNSHRGSASIDGSGHAAVSATYAVANALAGKALAAAGYAAYATVYAYGGYALNDPSAFQEEFDWQVEQLRRLQAGQPAQHQVTH